VILELFGIDIARQEPSMPTLSLDQIEIAEPCPASWNKMRGNNSARFCQHCRKFVHDLSAMPQEQAEQLVCQSGANLCIRFQRAPDGQIMTLDYWTQPKQRGWSRKVWTGIAIAIALCAGLVNAAIQGKVLRPFTTRMAGAMTPRSSFASPSTAPTQCPTANSPSDD